MLVNEIRENLFAMRDEKYRDFQAKLIPTIDAETVIGVQDTAAQNLREGASEAR